MRALAFVFALTGRLVVASPTVTCQTFYTGICPYGGSCQCTLNETCTAADPFGLVSTAPPSRAVRADGSCAGACLQVITGQCPGPNSCLASSGPCVPPTPCVPPPPNNTARSVLLTLKSQGFPAHPGALVYVPRNFDAAARNVSLVVFVHGFHNCVQNCVLPTASGCNCSVSGDKSQAYGLIDAFESAASADGSRNSLFVAIEVAYDEASSDPGLWAQPGLFASFLTELLANAALAPLAGGPRTLDAVSRVRIFSHSGGYNVIGAIAAVGGVNVLREVVLLDSLYGDFAHFDTFVQTNLNASRFGLNATQVRFISVYTDTGGTEANNRAMEIRVAGWLRAANQSALLYFDDTLGPLPPAALDGHSIVFKRSSYTHDDTCRHFFAAVLDWIHYQ